MSIMRAVLVGNLTRDPELREAGGQSVVDLRVACNARVKRDGEWTDTPNYFDVTVWGGQADACANHLAKGSQVAVDGQLRWREWETPEGGKRQAVSIVADSVRFIGAKAEGGGARPEPQAQQDNIPF